MSMDLTTKCVNESIPCFGSSKYLRDRSLNMGGGGPEDFQGGPPIFSQASKGGPLSFSRGQ